MRRSLVAVGTLTIPGVKRHELVCKDVKADRTITYKVLTLFSNSIAKMISIGFIVTAFCLFSSTTRIIGTSSATVVVSSANPCAAGEQYWCQNESTAVECGVKEFCKLQQSSEITKNSNRDSSTLDKPVLFELYYESLCGGCRDMIRDQIYKAYTTLYSTGIMQIGLYPYGNAHEKQLANGTWAFECQHGEVECQMNLIETCAIHLMQDKAAFMPFIYCLERSGPNMANARACASATNVDFARIVSCASTAMGNQLEHDLAVKTSELNPKHDFVPWVTVNGQHTWEIQDQASSDLIGLICDTYTGAKPDACQTHKKKVDKDRCYK